MPGVMQLHRAGEHARCSFRQGQILVSIHADGVYATLCSSGDSAVTGLAASAEDHIRALVDHRVGGCGAPLGIGEGLVEADIAVIDNEDFHSRVNVGSAGAIAFTEAPDGRNSIGTTDGTDLAAFAHHGSQSANQEASVVFGEVQACYIGNIGAIVSINSRPGTGPRR